MIAKDGVTLGAGEGAEDLGAAVGCVSGSEEGEGAACDEVAGEKNEVGREVVDSVNDTLKKEWLGELVEVNVAELDDAVVVEVVGEIPDADGLLDDVEVMACDLARVEGEACCGDAGANEKFATSKTGRLVGSNSGHRP